MADPPSDDLASAARALSAALKGLWLRAGMPKHESITKAVGRERSRISAYLREDSLDCPDRETLNRIVKHLGGDPADFEELWLAYAHAKQRSGKAPSGPATDHPDVRPPTTPDGHRPGAIDAKLSRKVVGGKPVFEPTEVSGPPLLVIEFLRLLNSDHAPGEGVGDEDGEDIND